MIHSKNEEDIAVAPDCFTNTFADNAIQHGSQIILHEFKNMCNMSDMGEGGEDEMEEAEEEVDEEEEVP
jgi:hypothetical protein